MSSGQLAFDYDVHSWKHISWWVGREWVVFILIIRLDGVTWWKDIGQGIYFLYYGLIINSILVIEFTMTQTSRSTTKFPVSEGLRILTSNVK